MEVWLLTVTLLFYLLSTAGFVFALVSARPIVRVLAPSCLLIAFVCHAGAIAVRSFATGYIAVTNVYEAISFFACLTAGMGLLCLYKEGPHWQARVVDRKGKPEPAWAARVLQALPAARSLQPDELELGDDWVASVRAMGAQLERAGARGQLVAAALFRFS